MESSLDDIDSERSIKKPRLFIARQACEHCRLKKQRCDENRPCALCRIAGIECNYGERKVTKNEVSLSIIMRKLERIDSKIEAISKPQPEALVIESQFPLLSTKFARQPYTSPANISPISFSANLMVDWPAVRVMLPPSLNIPIGAYALELEDKRPALPFVISRGGAERFLDNLSVSVVRKLSDAYFVTFNLTNPVLDRGLYFQHTLGSAINSDFGYDADSCIVLMTMALGCWGSQALAESPQLSSQQNDTVSPIYNAPSEQGVSTDIPGLAFYNEARKRIGFLECEHSIQTCQLYLLMAIYQGQLLRPVDCWSMVVRAGICCVKFWRNPPQIDEWIKDMYSRLFWVTVMFETLLTQELTDLASSKVSEMEDVVPLPKFRPFRQSMPVGSQEGEDESFYHYHFLSQIAHRIFLTRVYNSIYYCAPNGDYPNPRLSSELDHQLAQWRSQLPPALRFDDDTPIPSPHVLTDILVVSWLRARYMVAKYHIGRPFLYKALHHPKHLTEQDLQKCKETLGSVLQWGAIMENISSIKSCSPLAFFACSQTFGQLLLMYCFRHNSDPRLAELLPDEWESWTSLAVRTLQDFSGMSPTTARNAEIAAALFPGVT